MRARILVVAVALAAGAAQAAPVPFNQYVKLGRGMMEADVIAIAGPPDAVAEGPQVLQRLDSGIKILHRTYTYVWRSSAATPYITSIDFTDGVAQALRRDRKF